MVDHRSEGECKEDLECLYASLLKHPSLLADEGQRNAFGRLYQSWMGRALNLGGLLDAAAELTAFFGDGHTNIEIPYTFDDRCIRLKCDWDGQEENALLLCEECDGIPENARVEAINGTSVGDIIRLLGKRIPHENEELVKSRMVMYPYRNYHVFSDMNLALLFGEQESYEISFLVGGVLEKRQVPLVPYDGFLDFKEDAFVSYEMDGNTFILHLDSCICDETYKAALEEAARLCKEHRANSFVLDLSRNMGGSMAVIDEFIHFTGAESFRRYEMIDYSSGEARYRSHRHETVQNRKKPVGFPDEMYCRVSCHTFSSARTFAVTLKDNGIAKIIGTKTGGKPNSYGMPKKSTLPNTGIRFRVSTAYFLRPDAKGDEALTLEPDKLVHVGQFMQEEIQEARRIDLPLGKVGEIAKTLEI